MKDKELENNKQFLNEINQELGEQLGYQIQTNEPPSSNRRGMRETMQNSAQMSKKAIAWIVVLSIIVLLLGGGMGTFFIMRAQGRNSLAKHIAVEGMEFSPPEEAIIADGGDTITWQGKNYEKKASVVNILCMGIDKTTELGADEDTLYGSAGQADSIFLAVLDTDTGVLTLLNLSRDTMTDVDIYNADGEYTDTRKQQLCTAYAYGDGGESSCLNMVKAVSGLMYGVPVDAYVAVDLPAVSILNDAVGGVEVTVLEDLSDKDPSLTEGSRVLLKGKLAETYVRSRNSELTSNSQRMARQRQYVTAFIRKAYTQARADWSVVLTLYQAVQAYSQTSLSVSQILYLASVAVEVDFNQKNIITIPGEVTMGEQYAEYYVDEEALFQTIMDTYYQEVS